MCNEPNKVGYDSGLFMLQGPESKKVVHNGSATSIAHSTVSPDPYPTGGAIDYQFASNAGVNKKKHVYKSANCLYKLVKSTLENTFATPVGVWNKAHSQPLY